MKTENQSFLDQLSLRILALSDEVIRQTLIILPNNRAKLFLTKSLLRNTERSLILPEIISSKEWIEKLSGLRIVDDYQLLPYLFKAYQDSADDDNSEDFDQFLSWTPGVLNDFKEMDHQLVDYQTFFSNLSDIKRIESWNIDESELSEYQKKYLAFCTNLLSLYEAFREELIKEHKSYQGLAERVVSEKKLHSKDPNFSHVMVAGFNALTKAEESIFKDLQNKCELEFWWDYDKYYTENAIQEAGFFARKNLRLNGTKSQLSDYFNDLSKEIIVHECSTPYEQSMLLTQLLENDQYNENEHSTAVVLADESLLLPSLNYIPDKVTDLNVTMGYPIVLSPYHALIDSCFKALINARKSNSGSVFYFKDVIRICRIVMNSSFGHVEIRLKLKALLNDIHSKFLVQLEFNEIMHALNLSIEQSQILDDSIGFIRQLKNLLTSIDNELKQRNNPESKINREFIFHHVEVLDKVVEMASNIQDSLDIKVLHRIWRHYSNLAKVQFTGEPLKGLQIMGLLETRNLDFKKVIILSMNEGILPASRVRGSLIPNDLKIKNGMRVYRENEAIYAYHFYRLIQRSKEVHLMFSKKSDDLGGGEKSRFITQLENELVSYNNKNTLLLKKTTSSFSIRNTELSIPQTTQSVELIKNKINNNLSPSAIITYLECPLDFYYKYVVGLKEQNQLQETAEADVLGLVVHEVLENLYSPYVGELLQSQIIEQLKKGSDEEVEKVFIKNTFPEALNYGKNLLTLNIAKTYISDFLDQDKLFVENNEVHLLALEKKISVSNFEESHNEGLMIGMSGTIDRLQRINGQLNVLDYKTGLIKPQDLKYKDLQTLFDGKKNKAMQLFSYMWLVSEQEEFKDEKISAAIYSMRNQKSGFQMLNQDKTFEFEKGDMKEFRHCLQKLCLEMIDENRTFSHKHDSQYCSYCH